MAKFGEVIQRARQFLSSGALAEAEDIYRQLVEAVPQAAEPWHELGIVLLQTDRAEEAAEAFRRAVRIDADVADYHANLAAAYRMLRQPAQAIVCFERAMNLGRRTPELSNNLALALKDIGQTDASLRAFDHAISLRPGYANAYFNRGNLLVDLGRLEDAADSYERAIAAEPRDASAHCKLGLVHCEIAHRAELGPTGAGRGKHAWSAAGASLRRAVECEPAYASALCNLATVLERQGNLAEAAACWRRVLKLEPTFAEGYNDLGALEARQGNRDEAAACWRKAIELKPDFVEAYNNLSALWTAHNRLDEAAECCQRALAIQPDSAEAHGNLAGVLSLLKRFEEAAIAYARMLELKPDSAEAHNNLGAVFEQQGRYDEAIACCRRALELKPGFVEATSNLGILLAQQGRVAEAGDCYLQALRVSPHDPVWRLSLISLCPNVFTSAEEMERFRDRLLVNLGTFDSSTLGPDFPNQATAGCTPSFNLQFHGYDVGPIRRAYAGLFRDCIQPDTARRPAAGRSRIAFVVTNSHERIFLKSTGGIVERMNPELFDVTVVGTERGVDVMRQGIAGEHVKFLGVPHRLDRFIEAIRAARFDLIYHWEVGTDSINYFLPFYRLALAQCGCWGSQITSGIPQMTGYLSSELIEPEGAAEQYTERLYLARTLPTFQTRVALPETPKPREAFGIAADRHLYLCAQQLGKFHPDFDPILAAILRRDPRGLVVGVQDRHGSFAADRLRERFLAHMPDVAERIVFLPSQANPDYLSLVAASDVLIDPLVFSGTNSSYDGFSLHKPIVTLPSQFQRGRYTLACYKKMGIMDCVAADAEQYIELALKLANDRDFEAAIVDKIRLASHVLFEDLEAVHEHERLFAQMIADAAAELPGTS